MSNHRLNIIETTFLYGAGFFGFYVLLVIGYGLGIYGLIPYINIGFRAAFLGLSVVLIVLSLHRRTIALPNWFAICYILFWVAWLGRLYVDGVIGTGALRMSPWEYFQRGVLITAIPAIAFATRLDFIRSRYAFRGVYVTSFVFVLIALYVYRHTLGIAGYRALSWHGFDALGLISPLILAYNAAALVSFSLWGLIGLQASVWRLIIYLTGLALGSYVIVMSGSRGAAVVVVAVFFVLIFSNLKNKKVFKRLTLLLAAGVGIVIIALCHPTSRHAVSRIVLLVDQVQHGDMEAGGGRLAMYYYGLKQFVASPIFGGSLVVEYSANYPHNYIIEALMATGLIGGVPFIAMFLYALYHSIRMQGVGHYNGWLGVLYINVAIAGMFSFSIITNMFWYALVAVVANASWPKPNRRFPLPEYR